MPRPCTFLPDPHAEPRPGCGVCDLYLSSPYWRGYWDRSDTGRPQTGGTPAAPAARAGSDTRGVCRHEGEVLERCTSCGGELRSVRFCDHPAAGHTRCTRGPNSGADPDVASCRWCPLYDPA